MMRHVRLDGMFLALLVVACAARAAEHGLLGHWTLDERAGRVARDSAGSHDGTIRGAAWTTGKLGGGLRFDGKDDYVSLGDLGAHRQVTVAFWMKAENLAGRTAWQGLVTSDAWEEGVLHFPIGNRRLDAHLHAGGARRGHASSRPLRSGVWHHVALALDAVEGTMLLYVDGAQEDEGEFPRLDGGIKLSRQVVGREFDGKGFSRYFQGAIDDVRIYGRMLSAKEIQMLCPDAVPLAARDWRNVRVGHRVPNEGYCDQPYVVVTREGHWLCTLTTGPGREGQRGQHVISTLSTDQGRTWSRPVDIEPSGEREASWVVPLVTPTGRVYAFYTFNGDNVHSLRGKPIRADTIGWYAYRYSDDGGRSWSEQRYRLPLRVTACDRGNDWEGRVQIFWGICKPIVVGRGACFAFTKLGKFMLEQGEGWLFRSDNILTEPDAAKLRWELLPSGDHGLRAPEFGSVQEEHNIVALGDGSLYCVYRTQLGHPCHAYSRDGGRTWTKPEFMTYTPGGRRIKTPRACPAAWRTRSGKFLFWFHNHSRKSFRGRNPVWVSGGIEQDGRIHWSQPEILLYDPGDINGMSYPCLIEQDGRTWVTETQKTLARVHELDKSLLEGLWSQGKARTVAREGLLLDLGPDQVRAGQAPLPESLDLGDTGGLTLEAWVRFTDLSGGQTLLDCRDDAGRGIALTTTDAGTLRIELSDGTAKAAWDTDPRVLDPGRLHHVVAIVDAGPRIISFVVDGTLCDGGEARTHGWTRYARDLGDVRGSGTLRLAPALKGELRRARLYGRYLRTSEAIANFHAGP